MAELLLYVLIAVAWLVIKGVLSRRKQGGAPPAESPQNRRGQPVPQRPSPFSPAPAPTAGGGKNALEDMLRDFLGVETAKKEEEEEDEEYADEPAERPVPPPRPAPIVPQPMMRQASVPAPMPRREMQPTDFTMPQPASSRMMAQSTTSSASGTGGGVPAFVSRLRGNPAALREAFVYTEIFGPPMADRMPDRST